MSVPRFSCWVSRRNRAIVCASALALATGCAGTAASKPSSSDEIRRALAEVERKNRNKLRDLENQVVVLEDRLRSSDRPDRRPRRSIDDDGIRLPVEVRAPEADDSLYEVVGADEDGVEIVYVGEAAEDRSVSIPTPPSRPPRRRASADDPGRRSNRAIRYGPSERVSSPSSDFGDHRDDRLGVTDRVGPTVDQQIRQARTGRAAVKRPAAASVPGPSTRVASRPRSTAPARAAEAPRSRAARTVLAPTRSKISKPRRVDREAASHDVEDETPRTAATIPPKTLYKRSYDALRAGDGDTAIAGFRDFLDRHPGHDFADNSRYWLGEAFYARADYATALEHFGKVLDDYPTGNKVPDALLKMGYCQLALGNDTKGRKTLAQVIERHPDSSPARLAARRLDGLSD